MTQTYFLLLTALPAFLAIPRTRRDAAAWEAVAASGLTGVRFFDAEAFSARCSDVMMVEGMTPEAFHRAIEHLRDGPVFTTPWFRLEDVVVTLENGHQMMRSS
ncbi:hypothetical protein KM176_09100 [Pseudooceanicola sp. CBS1P-1]|uniref:DUF3303 domain-containing protein n=1 Tax=Pseudooceanicola albus TaxID=2692189 RepID=A0A6L7FZ78_9RHOB|nr:MULTISPECIES: darcynin family protein [Pseudooceanicola]MBT9384012.1 hypothetical protein [Pseudooceanicola endophyticus]MXN16576.1 hypothetical protein [Pseudooceanicola albus]